MTTRPTLEPRPAGEYAHVEQLPDPPRPYDAMYQLPYVSSAFSILDVYFNERPDVLSRGGRATFAVILMTDRAGSFPIAS